VEKITYQNLPDCIRLANGEVEAIVTTGVGPRILFYGFSGGENILGEHFDAKVETRLGVWKPYGGHRLWIAPENMPNSYAPDNQPLEYEIKSDLSIKLIQPTEPVTKTQKEITLTVDERGSGAKIFHKITNLGEKEIKIAAWALTIMRGGGVCEIPNEPFAAYSAETLLPVRNLSLWSYTDFSDSRWQFSKNFIRLRVDESKPEPQKIGVFNRQGWTAYEWENLRFVKHFEVDEAAEYADMNSNVELYTAGSFIEVETLSPLKIIAPNDTVEHAEKWELFKLGA
jgi:hypothetical protein